MPSHRIAILDLSPCPTVLGAYNINRVNVPAQHRGKGHGSALLRQVCDDADHEQVPLTLSINSYGEMTHEQLRDWYERYGFVEMGDEPGLFVREPEAD